MGDDIDDEHAEIVVSAGIMRVLRFERLPVFRVFREVKFRLLCRGEQIINEVFGVRASYEVIADKNRQQHFQKLLPNDCSKLLYKISDLRQHPIHRLCW
jgi:hypothetical protein